MQPDPPQPSPKPQRSPIPWTTGFQLFCQDYSLSAIAQQLGCSIQAVSMASRRMCWPAKRAKLRDHFPPSDPINGFAPQAFEALTWQASELERIAKLEDMIHNDLNLEEDRAVRSRLYSNLNALAERRRVALGVPLPGSRRQPAEKLAKRGVVSSVVPEAITDALVVPVSPDPQANLG